MFSQAVILAGGEGTRLRPVTYEIPKPLVPVQGKPILTWQVEWFARAGVKKILVTVPPKWIQAFEKWRNDASRFMLHVSSIEIELWAEPEPMGTMGALVHQLSDRFVDQPIFVTNGDELKGLDLKALAEFHLSHKNTQSNYTATIALVEVPNPSDYGVAEMNGDLIQAFQEKPADPPSHFINSGLYVLEPAVLRDRKHQERFLMFEKNLFPELAATSRLGGCVLTGQWFDCGTMERWEKAIKQWQEPRGTK